MTTKTQGDRFSAGHTAHQRHGWSLWWARALGWVAGVLLLASAVSLAWYTWR